MKQNHRNDFRYPVELDVDLYHQGRKLGHFKTSDIGPRGLFIATGPTPLSPVDPVRIALYLADGIHMAKGIVAHRSIEGVGVRFAEVSPSVFHALDDLLSIPDFSMAHARYYSRIKRDSATVG